MIACAGERRCARHRRLIRRGGGAIQCDRALACARTRRPPTGVLSPRRILDPASLTAASHAFTLVETLLCLVLLALLAATVVAWVETAAAIGPQTLERFEEKHEASAVFALIAQDLTAGDFSSEDDAPPRVEADGSVLRIRTRQSGIGAVLHEYRFEVHRDQLVRRQQRQGGVDDRVLLDNVDAFTVAMDVDDDFSVTLQISGNTHDHHFKVP